MSPVDHAEAVRVAAGWASAEHYPPTQLLALAYLDLLEQVTARDIEPHQVHLAEMRRGAR